MIGCAAGDADQAANRRVVNDGAASLAHASAELVIHAVPDAAQIDPVHPLEFFAADISHFHGGDCIPALLNAARATKGNGLLDHSAIQPRRDIAANADAL